MVVALKKIKEMNEKKERGIEREMKWGKNDVSKYISLVWISKFMCKIIVMGSLR